MTTYSLPNPHKDSHANTGSDPIQITESQVTGLSNDLAAKAPLASPALTGTPTAPTAAALNNSTKVATTAYADSAVSVEKSRAVAAETAIAARPESASRLIVWGHSYVAPPSNPYGQSNIGALSNFSGEGIYPGGSEMWPVLLRDALGVTDGSFTREYFVPSVAAGSSTTTLLGLIPEDCIIESVWYLPGGTITGANTNTRSVSLSPGSFAGASSLQSVTFTSGTNASPSAPIRIYSVNDNTTTASGGWTHPYFPALRGISGGGQTPQELYWVSTKIGTGIADSGGVVIVRYGTRYRNYGVSGTTLLAGALPFSNWLNAFSFSPYSRSNGVEVNTTAQASSGATSISCSPLRYPIANGETVYFANGYTATLSADAHFAATSLTVTSLANTIPANSQGHTRLIIIPGQNGGAGETLSPFGINVWMTGVNDADSAVAQDVNAWTETVRAVIAKNLCPAWNFTNEGNFIATNGNGIWRYGNPGAAFISNFVPYRTLPLASDTYLWTDNGIASWSAGSSSPTSSDKFTYSVGPAFEGGVIDLVFLGLAGSSLGVAGTITVDGGTPPQGSVTINTSGVSTSGLLSRTQATCNVANSTTFNGSNGVALSTLGTLTLAATASSLGFNTTGSGTIVTSGGTHTFTWTGTSGSTLTGCVYAGTQSDTVASGAAIKSTTLVFPTSTIAAGDVGSVVTGTYIPSGSVITAILSTTTATLSNGTTGVGSSETVTVSQYVPMVKRLTGLSSGAHTITFTVTGQDSTNSAVFFYGMGLESQNPTAPVIWCNIPKLPAQTSQQLTNTTALNAASAAVIAGTATPLTGNTAEPALPSSVQLVDIDTLLGASATYFIDGTHPNARGARKIAGLIYSTIQANYSTDQMLSR